MTIKGKCVCVVNDFTVDEQLHLYKTAANVKRSIMAGEEFPENGVRGAAYLMFLEDSTRTKESFRNAASTLGFRVNLFDATSSSINKFETLNDTVRMLCGYTPAMETVFVIRSKIEGLCQALSDTMSEYANRSGLKRPIFVNAGDGRHEHPTQEFLDEFSFLEQLHGDRSKIHIALVGDLLLGRTVHSKADGLCIFKDVTVDLIAPKELQLPSLYVNKMSKNGFKLRFFESIDEYMSNGDVAPILYFTRLQLERMNAATLKQVDELRAATSLRDDMLPLLPKGAKIYHPLPRHGEFPEIPFSVDATEYNGYDEQSRNGYFVRTALMGLLTGVYEDIDADYIRDTNQGKFSIVSVPRESASCDSLAFPESISYVTIRFSGQTIKSVRESINKFQQLTKIDAYEGIAKVTDNCALFSIPEGLSSENSTFLTTLFAFFIGMDSVSVTDAKNNRQLSGSFSTGYNLRLGNTVCPNTACVSHPNSKQRDVTAVFIVNGIESKAFSCRYCEAEASGVCMWK